MSRSPLPYLETIGARLEFATREKAVFAAVVRALGNDPVTLKRYIRGATKIPAEAVAAVARATGLPPGWLLTGEEPGNLAPDDDNNVVYIPRLAVRASAGSGLAVVPQDIETDPFAVSRAWLRMIGITSPEDAQMLWAQGDSMEPTIMDGDMMVLNRRIDRLVDGKIYVFVVEGFVLVKRLQVLFDGSLRLSSDNSKYETQTVSPDRKHELTIEGRVVWYGRAI